ncbi:hypothetical protein, partial [Priestia megaterium]|uniref:hypothetical protein n=2 Tax=Priestia megaterium TaxID=1404 RepID=UPI003671663A
FLEVFIFTLGLCPHTSCGGKNPLCSSLYFLRSHDVNSVLEKDRETQLKTSYLTFLQAHDKEKPQGIDSMLARVNAENDYVILKSSALKEK